MRKRTAKWPGFAFLLAILLGFWSIVFFIERRFELIFYSAALLVTVLMAFLMLDDLGIIEIRTGRKGKNDGSA